MSRFVILHSVEEKKKKGDIYFMIFTKHGRQKRIMGENQNLMIGAVEH